MINLLLEVLEEAYTRLEECKASHKLSAVTYESVNITMAKIGQAIIKAQGEK